MWMGYSFNTADAEQQFAHFRQQFRASIASQLAAQTPQVTSTVPGNGDVNPYGVTFVPNDFARGGSIHPGDVLVSNFNNSNNIQGTGSTVVDINRSGQQSVFFQGTSSQEPLGLTTALGVLRRGFVLVGNVPTTTTNDVTTVTGTGSLLILDNNGNVVTTLTDPKLLDGPWDLTVHDEGSRAQVFVSNVLNGTVTRLDLALSRDGEHVHVLDEVQVASGYQFGTDPNALVVGPTGLVYDARHDILYVASTKDNAIFAVSGAGKTSGHSGTGKVVFQDNAHLRGPLGLAMLPNGDLIAANGDAINADTSTTNPQNSELVEFTPSGKFVGEFQISTTAGGAFGVAVSSAGDDVRVAAVNDITNQLEVWNLDLDHHHR
jgi:hypothetical protein